MKVDSVPVETNGKTSNVGVTPTSQRQENWGATPVVVNLNRID